MFSLFILPKERTFGHFLAAASILSCNRKIGSGFLGLFCQQDLEAILPAPKNSHEYLHYMDCTTSWSVNYMYPTK